VWRIRRLLARVWHIAWWVRSVLIMWQALLVRMWRRRRLLARVWRLAWWFLRVLIA
jgi:hypothetical protein